MNLLKEVLANEVFPAFGCTEPVSCAYAAATAAAHLGEPVKRLLLRVDPGTYKNGAAVVVPHSGGTKGNLIAAVLGAVLAKPDAKLELLQSVTGDILRTAKALCDSGCCRIECLTDRTDFRVEVEVAGDLHQVACVLAGGHTRIAHIERDGQAVFQAESPRGTEEVVEHALSICEDFFRQPPPSPSSRDELPAYRLALKKLNMAEVLALAEAVDDEDRAFLRRGVEMNLAISEWGFEAGGTAQQLLQMQRDGYLTDDMFYRAKLRVASAVDARMAGMSQAAMTSGGSGNQGIVAILTPYIVGREMGIDADRIIKSIAAAHLVNAYVKCFVGEISVICGCAMAAGIASATAIVYQQKGIDLMRITLAVNNVIGDLGGLICDGAKPGCAMKAVTAVDTAIRSGLMALKGFGLSADDGLVGLNIEDSLRNLGRITLDGMFQVDPTILRILQEKAAASGKA
jgi:L-cysteine desulfidase